MPVITLYVRVPFSDVFLTQFSALQTSRSVRTRRLAAAEENTEVTRTARLAHIFKEICDMITSYKGQFTWSAHHTPVLLSSCPHSLTSYDNA